jgi:pimeloyl-ACP methyl ester carboxylesterase
MYRDGWVRVEGAWLHYQEWPPRQEWPPQETAPRRPGGPAAGLIGSPSSDGTESGPILLLHGLTQQSHSFDDVARLLSVRRRCLALDVRGRGESAWGPPEAYTIPEYAKDVLAFLEALGLPAVHLLGTSMGGLIGLSLAAVAPQRLLSLGLNDIGPEIDSRGVARIAGYVAAVPASFETFEAVVAWGRAEYPWLLTLPQDGVAEFMRWAVRRGSDGAWRLKWDPAIGRTATPDPALLAAAQRIWWDAFTRLRVPVLLVRGAESDILSAETAEGMARLQPALVRVDVPGVGHAPTLTEAAVLATLDRFYGGASGIAADKVWISTTS